MVDTIRGMVADQATIEDSVKITGNLVLNGSFNYKPFYLAGKVVGTTGVISSKSRGKVGFCALELQWVIVPLHLIQLFQIQLIS